MTDAVAWQGKAPFSLWVKTAAIATLYSYTPLSKLLPELFCVQVLFALTSLWRVLNETA